MPRRKKIVEKPVVPEPKEEEPVIPVRPSSVPEEVEEMEIDQPPERKPKAVPDWEGEAEVEEPVTSAQADSKKKPRPPAIHISLYRKIASAFAVATGLILVVVLYLAFARATITVVPRKVPVSTEVLVTVRPQPTGDEVKGVLEQTTAEKTKTVPIAGEGRTEEAQAVGTVTLINLTSRGQPLVATTRLLSEGGALFRLKSGVTVSAGGRLDAEVYADKPGASGNIEPSKFTIPGLNSSLQQSIYAVSTTQMTGGVRTVKVVTEADVESAVAAVERELADEATATLRALAGDSADGRGEIVSYEATKRQTGAAVGTEASAVEVTVGIRAEGVFYDLEAVEERALSGLRAAIPAGQELVSVDKESFQVTVERSDAEAGVATLKILAAGDAAVNDGSDIFDREKLAGLSAKGVAEYFKKFPEIEAASVRFRPSWLRRVPKLKDHIDIVIVR